MRYFLIALVALTGTALAQTPTPTPSADNLIAQLAVLGHRTAAENDALRAQVADLTKQLEAARPGGHQQEPPKQ